MSEVLPVISLARLRLNQQNSEEESSLRAALFEHGFFYLSDHGIPQDLIDTVFQLQADFFARPDGEKRIGIDRSKNLGWTPVQQERLDESRTSSAGDLKESFYVGDGIVSQAGTGTTQQGLPPSLERSRNDLEGLWQESRRVALEVLEGFAKAIGIQKGFFTPHHTGGLDRLRLIHYPPAPATLKQTEEGDIRASQHSDYGSCTLLFQKAVGGLQVKLRPTSASPNETQNSVWIDVPPRPGCLVVNVGDAVEFWTAGRLRSTVHRVRMPQSESEAQSRYSIAFFCQPDDRTTLDPALLQPQGQADEAISAERKAILTQLLRVKGIPLSADGRPPTGGEYLQARLAATYSS
ncbi:hypothetical protein CF326_g4661 [Tilletia indica]|nr:hypothetical protein CF326_g4661 [Tilletia indica]